MIETPYERCAHAFGPKRSCCPEGPCNPFSCVRPPFGTCRRAATFRARSSTLPFRSQPCSGPRAQSSAALTESFVVRRWAPAWDWRRHRKIARPMPAVASSWHLTWEVGQSRVSKAGRHPSGSVGQCKIERTTDLPSAERPDRPGIRMGRHGVVSKVRRPGPLRARSLTNPRGDSPRTSRCENDVAVWGCLGARDGAEWREIQAIIAVIASQRVARMRAR